MLAVVIDRYISPWGCAALELVIAVTASYLSIGRFGYAALVSGITMVMVANSGDLSIALWRMLNVSLGVGVAQAFAILVPSRACEHWFFVLGDNLRDLSFALSRHRARTGAQPAGAGSHLAARAEIAGAGVVGVSRKPMSTARGSTGCCMVSVRRWPCSK